MNGSGKLHFSNSDVNASCLGYIVEHHVMQSVLYDLLKKNFSENVDIVPNTVEKIDFPDPR